MADNKKRYRVVAPYVTFKTATASGMAVMGFHEGAIVPDDATEASVQHHLDRGLIAEIKSNAAPAAAPLQLEVDPLTGPVVSSAATPAATGKQAGKDDKVNDPEMSAPASMAPVVPAQSRTGSDGTGGPRVTNQPKK